MLLKSQLLGQLAKTAFSIVLLSLHFAVQSVG